MPEHVPSDVVAAALRDDDAPAWWWGDGPRQDAGVDPDVASRIALRALATDERVRAGLVRVMHRCAPPGAAGECFQPCGYLGEAGEHADAILAALCPPDGQDGPETGAGVSGHGGAGGGAVRGAEGVGCDDDDERTA